MDNTRTDRQALSVEDQALLCSARPILSDERAQRLAGLLASPLDWSAMVEQADRHGMAPLLYRHVRALPDLVVPRTAMDWLARQARARSAWNLYLYEELDRLLAVFNGVGVPVMPLKGLHIGSLFYGDLTWRPTVDLDLLVPPECVASAERTLQQHGCRKLPAGEQGADYHISYATRDPGQGGVVIELHTALGEQYVAGLDVQRIWAAAKPIVWHGRTIWTMALPDLLLYLCLHAVKDGLASVKSLLDIALLLEQFGEHLPWTSLARHTAEAGLRTPVFLCLLQCRDLLDAPVPDHFLTAIRPRRTPGWIFGQALFRWRGGVLRAEPALLTGPIMALQMFLWEDSLRGKLRHFRRNLLPSASLRGRWTSTSPSSSMFLWYPAWLWKGWRHLSYQLATRQPPRPSGPSI